MRFIGDMMIARCLFLILAISSVIAVVQADGCVGYTLSKKEGDEWPANKADITAKIKVTQIQTFTKNFNDIIRNLQAPPEFEPDAMGTIKRLIFKIAGKDEKFENQRAKVLFASVIRSCMKGMDMQLCYQDETLGLVAMGDPIRVDPCEAYTFHALKALPKADKDRIEAALNDRSTKYEDLKRLIDTFIPAAASAVPAKPATPPAAK